MQLTTILVAAIFSAVASARAMTPIEMRAAVVAKSVCPDPFSPCQYEEDGECQFGYAACLQKMGCSNTPGGADCIGLSIGCLVCN
ncbi:hypothetical protein OQA88_11130 [Cercophora sp. LCS_1]